jgi:hypothetical protein
MSTTVDEAETHASSGIMRVRRRLGMSTFRVGSRSMFSARPGSISDAALIFAVIRAHRECCRLDVERHASPRNRPQLALWVSGTSTETRRAMRARPTSGMVAQTGTHVMPLPD